MLSVRKVTMSFGGAPLLEDASLEVSAGERVCLVGHNGAGKSTLLGIVDGTLAPDQGEVQLAPGNRLASLPQTVPADLVGTIESVVSGGLDDTGLPEWEMQTQVERILEEMELEGGRTVETLSAGLKRRVLLARALVSDPELLILDEPTNHLDLPAIRWTETFLRERYRGALLFVTHDRTFLQNVATRIIDLDRGRLISWDCDYRTYLERKAEWLAAEAHQQAEFDKKLAEEERWIRRGIQARRTRNEGRVRALKRMREEHRARRQKIGSVNLQIDAANRSGNKVIAAEEASFAYGDTAVINPFSTLISRGDRIGIVGPNGAGKTTLLRLLLGELSPASGEVQLGTNLEIAYFDQLRNQLDEDQTVVESIAGGSETVSLQGGTKHVMSYLGDFLFPPDRARSPVSMLSGGERNRLLLARLFTRPANLLVLDEPTNDLDLETLELLEERLTEFTGTILLVSHDRSFLDHVVTDLLVLDGSGSVESFVGGYSDYLAQKRPPPPAPARQSTKPAVGKRPPRPRKFLNRERWELEALPGEIEELESEQAVLAERLADPSLYQGSSDALLKIQSRIHEIESKLPEKYARWEELESLREALEGGN